MTKIRSISDTILIVLSFDIAISTVIYLKLIKLWAKNSFQAIGGM